MVYSRMVYAGCFCKLKSFCFSFGLRSTYCTMTFCLIHLINSVIQGHYEQQSVLPASKSDACPGHARDSDGGDGQCARRRQE